MPTTISRWGNSDAVRIPQNLLAKAGLRSGDSVDIQINDEGLLELVPACRTHRHITPESGVTFDSLFKGYEGGRLDDRDAWPDDELIGTEQDAWLS